MKKLYMISVLTLVLLSCVGSLKAQDRFAVKTNLLYGGVARTPNLGVEIGLAALDAGGFGGLQPVQPSGQRLGQ